MLASSTKSYSNLSNLVGLEGDCSNMFAKLFIKNTDQSINDTAADIKKSRDAYDFMRAGLYTTKLSGRQSDNDVIHEFTDFIVQIALYHREIDTVVQVNEHLSDFHDDIKAVAPGAAPAQDSMWGTQTVPLGITAGFGRINADELVFNIAATINNSNLTDAGFMLTTCANNRANIVSGNDAAPHANKNLLLQEPGKGVGPADQIGQGNGAAQVFVSQLVSDRLLLANAAIRVYNNAQRLLAIVAGLSYRTANDGSQEIARAIRLAVVRLANAGAPAIANQPTLAELGIQANLITGSPAKTTAADIAGDIARTATLTPSPVLNQVLDRLFDAGHNDAFPTLFAHDIAAAAAPGAAAAAALPAVPTRLVPILVNIYNLIPVPKRGTFITDLKNQLSTKMIAKIKQFVIDQVNVLEGAVGAGGVRAGVEPSTIRTGLERDIAAGGGAAGVAAAEISRVKIAATPDNLYDKFKKALNEALMDAVRSAFIKNSDFTTRAVAPPAVVPGAAPVAVPLVSKTQVIEQIWKNVYGKWNTFTALERDIFNSVMSFQTLDVATGQWSPIATNNMGAPISPANYANYRVNLKKTAIGEMCPNFIKYLPKFDPTSFGTKVWYTNNATTQREEIDTTSILASAGVPGVSALLAAAVPGAANPATQNENRENLFRILYCAVFRNDQQLLTNIGLPNVFPLLSTTLKPCTLFNINVSKFMRRRLYNAKTSKNAVQQTPTTIVSMMTKDIWSRNAKGNLVRTDPDTGAEVEYGIGLQSESVLEAVNNCYTTGVSSGNETECNRYMNECLLNGDADDVNGCLEFWKKTDFYKVAKEEISKMHPLIALKTLGKFGFKQTNYMENGTQLKRIQTKDEWVKNTLASFATNANAKVPAGENLQNIISSNSKLLDYLQLLTEYVNANPAIMNKNYTSSSQPQSAPQQWTDKTELGKQLFTAPAYIPNKSALNGIRRIVQSNKNTNRGIPAQAFTPFGTYNLNSNIFGPAFTPFGIQNGGDNSENILQITLVGEQMKSAIKTAFAELESKGVKVSDGQTVMDLIKKLIALEKNLAEIYRYLQVVSDSRNLLAPTYTPQVNTLEEIKILAEQSKNQAKKHSDITQMLKDALEALTKNGLNSTTVNGLNSTTVVSGQYDDLDTTVF